MAMSMQSFLQKGELKQEQERQRKAQMKMQEFLNQKCGQHRTCHLGTLYACLYQKFLEKRPPDMCTPSSPFYLAVNHKGTKISYWYIKQLPGVTLLSKFMKELAKNGEFRAKKKKPISMQDDDANLVLCQYSRFNHYAVVWTQECRQPESL